MLLTLKEAIHTVHPTRSALTRSLGLGLAALLACTALAHRFAPAELGPFLRLLFVLCPLGALLLGAAAHRLGLGPSPALLVCAAVYLAVVLARYNASALVYVPVYALAGLAGHTLSRRVGRSRVRRAG